MTVEQNDVRTVIDVIPIVPSLYLIAVTKDYIEHLMYVMGAVRRLAVINPKDTTELLMQKRVIRILYPIVEKELILH